MEFNRTFDARLVTSVVACGIMSFSGVVVETSMNVTFPTLMEEFSVGTSTVQWITTGYLLVLSLMIPLSSFFKRTFKLKSLFIFSACTFLAGTLLSALAPSFAFLLGGRLIQGVGTGIALPLMFNIILDQAPQSLLGTMMGVGNLITAIAPAVGPSFGGYLISTVGWRAVFWCLVPLVSVALLLGAATIRQSSELERPQFDPFGIALISLAFSAFIFAGSGASHQGWLAPSTIGLFCLSAVALGLFCRHSLRASEPPLRVAVLANPIFALSTLSIVLIQLACLGIGFLLPNHAQIVMGMDAFAAGLLFVPGCLLGAVLSLASGAVLDRMGAMPPVVGGSACILLATVLFALSCPNLTPALATALYMLFAFGQGNCMGTNMSNGLAHLNPEQKADGNAIINTLQQLSGAIGTTLVSTVVASQQLSDPEHLAAATTAGTTSAFMLTAVFAAIAFGCALTVFCVRKNQ